ncbi:MAG TPA: PilT/PilU family type 4a pilus ATPase [Gaiellaceae bacterium]|nr:PilT/PilU family type 4a pilus ATPase [Gaiellaceae bacterium]
MDLNEVLGRACDLGASDVHLKIGQPPMVRIDGRIERLSGGTPLALPDLQRAVATVTESIPERRSFFERTGELDLSYQPEGLPRFRVNVFRQRGSISLAFRVIPNIIPSFGDLHLPKGIARLAEEHFGLVLVTGATGSGKSTTLAAVVDHINQTRQQHIVTIEDPIEMLHTDHQSIVNQREVGIDTESFEQALRRVLRQDPDVILLGELRDAETAQTAMQAAESGHLVLSTLHTVDAAETIGRLTEFFPPAKQELVRSILAGTLKGIVSQRLLPRLGGGRIAAVEVMVTNDRISELVRENRSEEIPAAIAEGAYYDMQTLTQALIDLVLDGLVARDVATNAAPNRHDFVIALEHAEKARAASAANPSIETAAPGEQQEEEEEMPTVGGDSDPKKLRLIRLPAGS